MIKDTQSFDPAEYDEIIDVRSAGEFAEDHIPGAINLPVLDNDERVRVGTIYVQQDAFLARKIGAALTARNIAAHVESHFASKEGDYRPLIHCWRGGQRSRSMALVLDQIGWRVSLLEGGYKRYRKTVIDQIYHRDPWFHTVLLEGMTGVGKTEVLSALTAEGAPTLDLEALARHRGSIFGAMPGEDAPSQKWFESQVLDGLPPEPDNASTPPPILILEAEASKVGACGVPPTLWKAMAAGTIIEIEAPLQERVRYTARRYADIAENVPTLIEKLRSLTQRHGGARIAEWVSLAEQGAIESLVEQLMVEHYDPAYSRAASRRAEPTLRISLEKLDDASFAAAAEEARAAVARIDTATL